MAGSDVSGHTRDGSTTTRTRRRVPAATYEFRTVTLGRDTSRADARQRLTEEAEYGRWELARTRLYLGGKKVYTLRRRIIRVERTL